MLAARGIEQLYSHQVAALEAARAGRDFVVVTGTASGKTLCYNLPILEAAIADGGRALYLFPTKALAQDQLKGLLELVASDAELARAVRPGVYDGDTPTAQRRRIRSEANLVLSNPDMLHAAVLPYHPKWAAFFAELRFVVVDEVHTYRGILGAHVSAVLRRLMRVCEHYGSRPVFLAASATIANPGELAGRLIGRDVAVIDDDGSPRGRKYFALWNPAPLGNDSLARRSASDDAVTWLVEAIEAGGQALAFTRTRQAAELIHRYAREQLAAEHSPLADKVRAYRGGYLPNERRADRAGFVQRQPARRGGDQRAGARHRHRHARRRAVGELSRHDRQQLAASRPQRPAARRKPGRAAGGQRSGRPIPAAASGVLLRPIAGARGGRSRTIRTCWPSICRPRRSSCRCAARGERPRSLRPARRADRRRARRRAATRRREGQLLFRRRAEPGRRRQPAAHERQHVQHRAEVEGGRRKADSRNDRASHVIANVDAISAPELVYPEAVYLHNGETYLVRELDLDGKVAYVERRETDYYTQAVLESNVRITGERATSDAVPRATLGYGDVDVAWQTVAFKKIKFATRENIGLGPGRHSGPESANDGRLARAGRCDAGRNEGGRPAGERRRRAACGIWRSSRCRSWRCATAATWAASSTARTSAARR